MKRFAILGIVGAAALAGAIVLNNRNDEEPPASPPAAAEGAPNVPRVDVVRANEVGDTVIAGRAPAHAEVTLLDGESVIGTVMADERGDWVFVPASTLAEGTRHISLSARLPDGRIFRSQAPFALAIGKKS